MRPGIRWSSNVSQEGGLTFNEAQAMRPGIREVDADYTDEDLRLQ